MCDEWMKHVKPMERLKRDDYFMEIARTVARRGTCPRASVGAVVVSGRNRILGTGYNGSPPGHPHCLDVGCKTIEVEKKTYCIRTIHAEVNAIINSLTAVHLLDTLTLYSTHFPCFECLKMIAASGIKEIRYQEPYVDPKFELMKEEYLKGIKFIQL